MKNRSEITIIIRELIAILLFIIIPLSAVAAESLFKWEPFTVREELAPQKPVKKDFREKKQLSEEILEAIKDDASDAFCFNGYREDKTLNKDKKKSTGRFKIAVSPAHEDDFIMDGSSYRSEEKDKVAKIMKELPNLFLGDNKQAILENLGKLIEPQVKVGFEF